MNKILNAAESVALRDGVSHLTLDAVAAAAGLSKGGVLYNFPSKDALVRGMIDRMIAQTEEEIGRLAEKDLKPHGRLLRAYLGVTFPEHGSRSARINRLAAVLLTAILTDPDLLDPVRTHFGDMQKRLLKDGLDRNTVFMIRLAADGLWLSDMLRMPGPKGAVRQSLIEHLYALTRK